MRIKSKLISFNINKCEDNINLEKYIFTISHENSKSTLEQDIGLIKDEFGNYTPNILIEGFDFEFKNSKDAMIKYADWLMRLGVALKVEAKRGNFSKVSI